MLIAFYIIFIARVNITFIDTAYELNKYLLIVLKILIFIAIILCIGYISILIIYKNAFLINKYFAISLISIEFILDISLSIIFIYKLFQVIISLNDEDQYNSNDLNKKTINQSSTLSILNVIVRHCLLFIFVIIANLLFLMSYGIAIFFMNNLAENFKWGSTIYVIRSFDNLCMIIALFLNLNINHSLYDVICKICHLKCLNCIDSCYKSKKQKHINKISAYSKM